MRDSSQLHVTLITAKEIDQAINYIRKGRSKPSGAGW